MTVCFSAFAQNGRPPQEDREKIQKAKIAFLTNRLELSVDQAKLFWPIFTEYDSKKIELSHVYNEKKKDIFEKSEDFRNMKEGDAGKLLDIYLDQKQAELDLEKTYVAKFNGVLDARQVWKVITFEGDFRRSLYRKLGNEEDKEPKRGGNRN
tara:strand:- start:5108 stop:5563 length:456 start_codon:yes stop_codon:yes gene_type:complete